jgi:hypothetical protein
MTKWDDATRVLAWSSSPTAMDISIRKFTLSPPSPDVEFQEGARSFRRIVVSADILKQAKLTAGDLCAIRGVTPDPLDEVRISFQAQCMKR